MTFEMVNSSLQYKGEFVHMNTFTHSLVRVKPTCVFLLKNLVQLKISCLF